MAENVGLSSGEYYARYENGVRIPSFEILLSICNTLEITLDFLFADSLKRSDDLDAKISLLLQRDRNAVEALVDQLIQLTDQDLQHMQTELENRKSIDE